jgi:hypothetical protein
MDQLINTMQNLGLTDTQSKARSLNQVFKMVFYNQHTENDTKQALLDLDIKVFDEPLVRAFFEDASVEAVRGFLKSYPMLDLAVSLETLSQELICNDKFSDPFISYAFWMKRVHLFEVFPCPGPLHQHLKTLNIIPVIENKDTVFISYNAYYSFLWKISNFDSFRFSNQCEDYSGHEGLYCRFLYFSVQ